MFGKIKGDACGEDGGSGQGVYITQITLTNASSQQELGDIVL